MSEAEIGSPVLVTGATGYVAGWIVKRLLDQGLTVHAAVRDPSKTEKTRHLNELASESPGTIHFFRSDLLDPGSYARAMDGCRTVFHTASPFALVVADPQRELVDPAKIGTRNVLDQATATGSVRRVVVTSSCAAIYGDNSDLEKSKDGRFTEEDWNTSSSLSHQPYPYSKVEAEREAWRIADTQKQWDLVTINPSLVIGPGTTPFSTSESFSLIRQLGDGRMQTGVPNYFVGAVDVRDVADAHIRAASRPEAHGRHIVSGHDTSFPEMARILRGHFGDRFRFPKRTLPKWMVWLVAPMVEKSMTRKIVSRNVDVPFLADNSKSVRELGMTYRLLEDSLVDMFEQLVSSGQVTEAA